MDSEKPRRGRPPKPPEERRGPNLTFRTPGGLRARLAEAAAASGRAMSEEVVHRLEQSFLEQDIVEELQRTLRIERRDSVLFGIEEAEKRGVVLEQQRAKIAELEAQNEYLRAELKAGRNQPSAEANEEVI